MLLPFQFLVLSKESFIGIVLKERQCPTETRTPRVPSASNFNEGESSLQGNEKDTEVEMI